MDAEPPQRQHTPLPSRSLRRAMRRRSSGEPALASAAPPEPAAPSQGAERTAGQVVQRILEESTETARAGFAREVMPRLHGLVTGAAGAADEVRAAAQDASLTLQTQTCLQHAEAAAKKAVQRTLEEMRACVERVEQEGEQLAREAGRLVREIEDGLRRISAGIGLCAAGPDPGTDPGPAAAAAPGPTPDQALYPATVGAGDSPAPFSDPEAPRPAPAKTAGGGGGGEGEAASRGGGGGGGASESKRRPRSTGKAADKSRRCTQRSAKPANNKTKQPGGNRGPQRVSKKPAKTTKEAEKHLQKCSRNDTNKHRKSWRATNSLNNGDSNKLPDDMQKRIALKKSCSPGIMCDNKARDIRSTKGLKDSVKSPRDSKLDNKGRERPPDGPLKAKKSPERKKACRATDPVVKSSPPSTAFSDGARADDEEPLGAEEDYGVAEEPAAGEAPPVSGGAPAAAAEPAAKPHCMRADWLRELAERKEQAYRQLQELLDRVPEPEPAMHECAEAALRQAELSDSAFRRRLLLCAKDQGHDEF